MTMMPAFSSLATLMITSPGLPLSVRILPGSCTFTQTLDAVAQLLQLPLGGDSASSLTPIEDKNSL